jgi:hypothetical protein
MADIAATDVTVTIKNRNYIRGLGYRARATLAFGDGVLTYPAGGIPLSTSVLGKLGVLRSVESFNVEPAIGDPLGVQWQYDRTDKTLRGYRDGPPTNVIEHEEVRFSSAGVGYLKYLPAHIYTFEVVEGTVLGAYKCIPTGKTPVTTEVAVTFTTGKLTTLAADAVVVAVVSYVPLAALKNPADRVVDESLVVSANSVVAANQACLASYVYASTESAGNLKSKAFRDKTPVGGVVGTNEVVVDWTAGAATSFVFANTASVTAALATYVKAGAFARSVIEEESVSIVSALGAQLKSAGVPSMAQFCSITSSTGQGAKLTHGKRSHANIGSALGTVRQIGEKLLAGTHIAFSPGSAAGILTALVTYQPMDVFGPCANPRLEELRPNETPAATTVTVEVVGF